MPRMKKDDSEGQPTAPPTGDMSAEEFRRHGHALIDWISDYFTTVSYTHLTLPTTPYV